MQNKQDAKALEMHCMSYFNWKRLVVPFFYAQPMLVVLEGGTGQQGSRIVKARRPKANQHVVRDAKDERQDVTKKDVWRSGFVWLGKDRPLVRFSDSIWY